MMLQKLLQSRQLSKSPRSSNRRSRQSRNRYAPRVESLEDRRLLAALTVDIGDPSANDPGDNLYAQIHEAVAAADEGDRIKIKAGTYEPFVVDTNNLTIRAANSNASPVIDATGIANGIEVNANDVSIRGLTVINADQNGFRVTGDSNTFTKNIAENNGGIGFLFQTGGDGNTLIRNTAVENGGAGFVVRPSNGFIASTPEEVSNGTTLIRNTAVGNGGDGFEVGGGALFIPETSDLELVAAVDTTLSHNQALGNSGDGFELSRLEGARVVGNLADDNDANGFFVLQMFDSAMVANKATGNGGLFAGDGFQVKESNDNVLTANTAEGSTRAGIRLWGSSHNTLLHNRAEGNAGNGFRLEPQRFLSPAVPADHNTLLGNVAMHNEGAGFFLSGASNNALLFNRATDNAGDGFRVEGIPPFFTLIPGFNSNDNFLFGNTARDNGGFGFSEDAVDDVFSSPSSYLFNRAEDNALGDFDV